VRGYVAILPYEQGTPAATSQPRRVELVTRFQQLIAPPAFQCRLVADYARWLCVTRKRLSGTVKAATGQTAGEWLAAQVLREARHLLGQPERSLTQLADELGFSDASAFGKFFFQRTGQT
jgi:AraC family transcriptional activator of pobA